MPSINLIDRLIRDFPQFGFQNASASRWSPQEQTIYYHTIKTAHGRYELFHELGHALSGHDTYIFDVELLTMEREAWDSAVAIAVQYDVKIPEGAIEQQLDTYRDWLHARSRCPHCHEAGLQQQESLNYHCVLCDLTWHANEAKHCGLRRYLR